MSEKRTAAPDLSALAEADADQLAGMVAEISDEQLADGLGDPQARATVLGEVFRRMAEHVEHDRIADLDAIVHFRITDAPGGGVDVYEVAIEDGACEVRTEATTEEPKVSFEIDPVSFLRLVTGAESGPAMFMTGRIKIKGDLMFASRMTSFFRIPGS
jgi:putative sterol carrier protein